MRSRLPSLEALRYFEACARHAHVTRAADELGVTAAALSLRIRTLERELGIDLFRRTGPRIALTPAGEGLAVRMAEALSIIRAAVMACRAAPEPIRVTAAPTLASRWLLSCLERYSRLPDAVPVTLDVSVETRAAGDFDVALRSGGGDWPGLMAERLFALEGTPMLSPALAAELRLTGPGDLSRCPLIPDDRWPDWLYLAGVAGGMGPRVATTFPTQEMATGAALAGTGVALLSPTLFAPLLAQGQLVQPFDIVLYGPGAWFLAWRPEQAGPSVRGLVALILGMAREAAPEA
ncbi:LysR substrate-binding domain-containing protein [Niveispirillum sp. KHB5.9]|uniref:LysR substrate-binding domain-containing protein n=1 Tax=Niveispirillum sp. KHB5.9 TaxID=3400269 RepID=UPI003A85C5D5